MDVDLLEPARAMAVLLPLAFLVDVVEVGLVVVLVENELLVKKLNAGLLMVALSLVVVEDDVVSVDEAIVNLEEGVALILALEMNVCLLRAS